MAASLAWQQAREGEKAGGQGVEGRWEAQQQGSAQDLSSGGEKGVMKQVTLGAEIDRVGTECLWG